MKKWTVEQIDAHIAKYEAKPASKSAAGKVDPCALYAKARPVLQLAVGLLFWKPKWQKTVQDFLRGFDASCNITE